MSTRQKHVFYICAPEITLCLPIGHAEEHVTLGGERQEKLGLGREASQIFECQNRAEVFESEPGISCGVGSGSLILHQWREAEPRKVVRHQNLDEPQRNPSSLAPNPSFPPCRSSHSASTVTQSPHPPKTSASSQTLPPPSNHTSTTSPKHLFSASAPPPETLLHHHLLDYSTASFTLQNSAARLLTHTRSREHVTPILRPLLWLLIQRRVDFKILLIPD